MKSENSNFLFEDSIHKKEDEEALTEKARRERENRRIWLIRKIGRTQLTQLNYFLIYERKGKMNVLREKWDATALNYYLK